MKTVLLIFLLLSAASSVGACLLVRGSAQADEAAQKLMKEREQEQKQTT